MAEAIQDWTTAGRFPIQPNVKTSKVKKGPLDQFFTKPRKPPGPLARGYMATKRSVWHAFDKLCDTARMQYNKLTQDEKMKVEELFGALQTALAKAKNYYSEDIADWDYVPPRDALSAFNRALANLPR